MIGRGGQSLFIERRCRRIHIACSQLSRREIREVRKAAHDGGSARCHLCGPPLSELSPVVGPDGGTGTERLPEVRAAVSEAIKRMPSALLQRRTNSGNSVLPVGGLNLVLDPGQPQIEQPSGQTA